MGTTVEESLEKLIKISEERLKVEKEQLSLQEKLTEQNLEIAKLNKENLQAQNLNNKKTLCMLVSYARLNSNSESKDAELLDNFLKVISQSVDE